jgi:hypothetical protein
MKKIFIFAIIIGIISGGFYFYKTSKGGEIIGKVKVGQTVSINGLSITVNKIIQDSRCAIDVQCIWAGSVTAEVTLENGSDKENKNIESGKEAISFKSFSISLEEVSPGKSSSHSISSEEYDLTFKVIKTK